MAQPISEHHGPLAELLEADRLAAGLPAVLRGLVTQWPAVRAARQGDRALLAYLAAGASAEPVDVVAATAATGGRFHYDDTITGFNFRRTRLPLTVMLAELAKLADESDPPFLAAQGVLADSAVPGFARENRVAGLPAAAQARLWIGNRVQVAIHADPADNLACNVAGRRRFTLFAPELLPCLGMGPFDPTPAGTPIALADPLNPDFTRFPRFAQALDAALQCVLEPGDALFLPYGWFHHVQSLDAVNLLVNHWWNDAPQDGGSPWDAMLHAIMTLRHLPENQRRVWQAMFQHYVFLADGDPAAHLPDHAAGVLRADGREDRAAMRRTVIEALSLSQK